jgi:hypothetical protein
MKQRDCSPPKRIRNAHEIALGLVLLSLAPPRARADMGIWSPGCSPRCHPPSSVSRRCRHGIKSRSVTIRVARALSR